MKPTDEVRDAYRGYLEGTRSLDEVLDLAERTWETIRAELPARREPTPEEIEAEEAEWARLRASGGSAPLRHAYQRYLDGEITIEELFDISDRLGTRIYEAKDRLLAARAGGARAQGS